METFFKKHAFTGELQLYGTLSSIATKYNPSFSTLVLPHALKIDKRNRTLTLPRYQGEFFDDKWNTTDGGEPLGLDLATEMPLVLKDLSEIEVTQVTSNKQLSRIPKLVFSHDDAVKYYTKLATEFKNSGALSSETIPKIRSILQYRQCSKMVFNNGDFYPCNFIRLASQKVVLIDWETWNPHSPFYNVDHPENIAAVPFVHMWGNSKWREVYMRELEKHFAFKPESFRKGIVIKALALARIFDADRFNKKGRERLIMEQMNFIEQALSRVS